MLLLTGTETDLLDNIPTVFSFIFLCMSFRFEYRISLAYLYGCEHLLTKSVVIRNAPVNISLLPDKIKSTAVMMIN